MCKLWLDPEGNVIPVGADLSHEEWAQRHGHDLEVLLDDAGWVRVQSVPPLYLYVDFRRPLVAAQAKALAVLFEGRFRQVVVEFRGESRSFVDGEEAMAWAVGRG